ncbi:MAG TPA: hypothetical protein VMT19_10240 [Thermoanaerobaculaceae bacterium]|nr:hypothetical protein [Thermoanaerobaculaceae bacterium]
MRIRWVVALMALSVAANVTLGAALWVSWHGGRTAAAALGATCSAPLCEEEKAVREQLAASLCAAAPDRSAIRTALAHLDEVRARQRAAIVERWLVRCSSSRATERAALADTVRRMLCPWQAAGGAACCAPKPGPETRHDVQPQHGQS